METPALEAIRAAGLQAPEADLPSLTSWQHPGSPQAGATTDEVLVGAMPRRAPGDAGQPGQAHRGGGRRQEPDTPAAARAGRHPASVRETTSRPPGLDTQARQDGTAATRHPDHARQSRTNAGAAHAGTRMGGSLRA